MSDTDSIASPAARAHPPFGMGLWCASPPQSRRLRAHSDASQVNDDTFVRTSSPSLSASISDLSLLATGLQPPTTADVLAARRAQRIDAAAASLLGTLAVAGTIAAWLLSAPLFTTAALAWLAYLVAGCAYDLAAAIARA